LNYINILVILIGNRDLNPARRSGRPDRQLPAPLTGNLEAVAESVLAAIIVVVGWVVSVCFHEFAHALAAYVGGDKSVKARGYLSFNPFAYSDIGLSVILPTLFILVGGIGLPGASVRIRPDRLSGKYWSALVSAAGPLATFLFALILVFLLRTGMLADLWLAALSWLTTIEIVVLILNLIPVPGLDGFGIIEPFLPASWRAQLRPFYKYGVLVVMALIWVVPGPNDLLWRGATQLVQAAGIHELFIVKGDYLYRQGSFPVAAAVIVLALIAYLVRKQGDWYERGQKLLQAEKYQECSELAQAVLQKADDTRAHKLKALSAAGLAEKAAQDGQPGERLLEKYRQEAHAAMEKCLSLEGDASENWLASGIVAETFKEMPAALASYKKALELDSDYSYAFARYCHILFAEQNFALILEACQERLNQIPDDGEALFQKAVALAVLEQSDEALALFDRCINQGTHRQLALKNRDLLLAKLQSQAKDG
jgi:Zn-dependent protease